MVKCFYLVKLSRTLGVSYPTTADLQKKAERLQEIASVTPNLQPDINIKPIENYKSELKTITQELTEILARSYIKKFPNTEIREKKLTEKGFLQTYKDYKEFHLREPALWMILGSTAVCIASVVIFLAIFDGLDITSPEGKDRDWFELPRIIGWSLGGSISYMLAVVMGLVFSEALPEHEGEKNPASYLLAFLFATLCSMMFFVIARDEFKPPHIWLAVNFGFLSTVVIACKGKALQSRIQVRNKALVIALIYAAASGLLQVMIRIAFKAHHAQASFTDVDFSALSLDVFFWFGFIRGFAMAFLVACIFLEFQRLYHVKPRREQRRIDFDDIIKGELAGIEQTVMVKNISEQGAMVKIAKGNTASQGDTILLDFPFGEVPGKVLAVQGRDIRVGFELANFTTDNIQQFINQRLNLAT